MNSGANVMYKENMTTIFQISPDDVERSSTLENNDIGKWAFVMNGCIMGFFDTRDEAEDALSRHRIHRL